MIYVQYQIWCCRSKIVMCPYTIVFPKMEAVFFKVSLLSGSELLGGFTIILNKKLGHIPKIQKHLLS